MNSSPDVVDGVQLSLRKGRKAAVDLTGPIFPVDKIEERLRSFGPFRNGVFRDISVPYKIAADD